jgi:tRNA (cmo5U34)-methyltransferase
VTLCVLTLMFTPIEHRFRILSDAFAHTMADGALILVEKILGVDARTNALLVDLYYRYKEAMGYTKEEIDRKRLSLEGVLVPVTAAWNEEMLHAAGFRHVECVWRCMNFCAWVAIKSET